MVLIDARPVIMPVVSGRVGYYLLDKNVPDAVLSMGAPNPDVASDASGHYAFAPYPIGNYVLHVSKTTHLLGINSLDAIKVVQSGVTNPFCMARPASMSSLATTRSTVPPIG